MPGCYFLVKMKEKNDYPIVLTTVHVQEIMQCSPTSARQYINVASIEIKKQGKIPPKDVVRRAIIPRDFFFDFYGLWNL